MSEQDNWELISGELAEMWKPEEADQPQTISGILEHIRTEVGSNKSTIYELKQDDGSMISFWGNGVLDSKLEQVELGTTIKVEFLGRVLGKNLREYKNYNVFTRK